MDNPIETAADQNNREETLLLGVVQSLLASDRPQPAHAATRLFIFGRTKEDTPHILQTASGLWLSGLLSSIWLNASDGREFRGEVPEAAWPGGRNWKRMLEGMRVPSDMIQFFGNLDTTHTGLEAAAICASLQDNPLKTGEVAAFLAYPGQSLRCMAALIYQLDANWGELPVPRIHCFHPQSTDWNEPSTGSQGKDMKPRRMHIREEIKKALVNEHGNLAPLERIEEYLTTE